MKKIYSVLISLLLSVILFCMVGGCAIFSSAASAKTSKDVNVVDLVLLKKHITKMQAYDADMDYNNDKKINSLDIAVLKKILLGTFEDSDFEVDKPVFDDDGYYNQVVKP